MRKANKHIAVFLFSFFILSINCYSQNKKLAAGVKVTPNVSFVGKDLDIYPYIKTRPRLGAGLGVYANYFLGSSKRYFTGVEIDYFLQSYSIIYNRPGEDATKTVISKSKPLIRINFGKSYKISTNNYLLASLGITSGLDGGAGTAVNKNEKIETITTFQGNRSTFLNGELNLIRTKSKINFAVGYAYGLMLLERTEVYNAINKQKLLVSNFRGSHFQFVARYNFLKNQN